MQAILGVFLSLVLLVVLSVGAYAVSLRKELSRKKFLLVLFILLASIGLYVYLMATLIFN